MKTSDDANKNFLLELARANKNLRKKCLKLYVRIYAYVKALPS